MTSLRWVGEGQGGSLAIFATFHKYALQCADESLSAYMTGCIYWVYDCLVFIMDSIDTAPDFMDDPDEDLADWIGDKAGLEMKYEQT